MIKFNKHGKRSTLSHLEAAYSLISFQWNRGREQMVEDMISCRNDAWYGYIKHSWLFRLNDIARKRRKIRYYVEQFSK